MQTKIIKAIQVILVAASMAAGFLFYQRFQPEWLMKPEGEIIGMTEINTNSTGNYSGKTAGKDISPLNSIEELEQLSNNAYISVTTREIISTDVYGLKPWVDPYSLTRMRSSGGRMVSTGRRAPEVTRGPAVRAEAYQEYYLIRLPDSGYCFAQVSAVYAWQLKEGEEITLPIGQKRATSNEERGYLVEIGDAYGADPSYLLYMVDDEWGEENHFTLFLIRFGASTGVFFVLAVGLLFLLEKVFPTGD